MNITPLTHPALVKLAHPFFADFRVSGGGGNGDIINAIIWLVGMGLVFWLLWWLIDYIKIPEPFSKVARVILAVAAVIILIRIIMRITGTSF